MSRMYGKNVLFPNTLSLFNLNFLDLKRDPVRLHDYYKKQWEKFRLPGDDSHETKELRWAVREWMMGRKPPES